MFYDVWGWSLVCIVGVVVVVTTITKGAELVVRVAEIIVAAVAMAGDTKRVCHAIPRIERGQIAVGIVGRSCDEWGGQYGHYLRLSSEMRDDSGKR